METAESIKVGLVGYGYWGHNYLRLLADLDGVQPIGVCDADRTRLADLCARHPDLLATTSFDELLHAPGLSAMVVTTPATTHFVVARRCLDAGKHVLVEKPLTTSARDATVLTEMASAAGLTLMAGHTFLYNAGVTKLREMITADELGQIYYLYARRTNLGPIRDDVNALWDLAPHDIAIFNHLLDGLPLAVSAVGSRILHRHLEDVGFVSLAYPRNVLGHVHVSWTDPHKVREIVVVGSKARAVFNDLEPVEPVRVFHKGVVALDPVDMTAGGPQLVLRDGDIQSPQVAMEEPLRRQVAHFADCVLDGSPPLTGGREGANVVRVMEAIDSSVASRGTSVEIQQGLWRPGGGGDAVARTAEPNCVQFVDLRAELRDLGAEVTEAIDRTLWRANFVLGDEVAAFEEEFASFCDARHGVGVDSGTSALELILRALHVGPGDEVITAANSFIATAFAVSHVGATPVFVDVDPDTRTIRADAVAAAITERTRAVVPVHLYGQPADVDPIIKLGAQHGFAVVEDACQAHGARYRQRWVGSLGTAAAFSFYPSKNLGALGDGGMVVTSDDGLAAEVRRLRNYGEEAKNVSPVLGFNRRLDELQAAVLRVKLRHLDARNAARAEHARNYLRLLDSAEGVIPPRVAANVEPVWHLFVVDLPHSDPGTLASDSAKEPASGRLRPFRDEVRRRLAEQGVETGVHYPIPIPFQPVYRYLGYRAGAFPIAEECAARVLSLPMHPALDSKSQQRVVEGLYMAMYSCGVSVSRRAGVTRAVRV